MRCPNCGDADQIDIAATVWVRVIHHDEDSDIETDASLSADGSHEWGGQSAACCKACYYYGHVCDFDQDDDTDPD